MVSKCSPPLSPRSPWYDVTRWMCCACLKPPWQGTCMKCSSLFKSIQPLDNVLSIHASVDWDCWSIDNMNIVAKALDICFCIVDCLFICSVHYSALSSFFFSYLLPLSPLDLDLWIYVLLQDGYCSWSIHSVWYVVWHTSLSSVCFSLSVLSAVISVLSFAFFVCFLNLFLCSQTLQGIEQSPIYMSRVQYLEIKYLSYPIT